MDVEDWEFIVQESFVLTLGLEARLRVGCLVFYAGTVHDFKFNF